MTKSWIFAFAFIFVLASSGKVLARDRLRISHSAISVSQGLLAVVQDAGIFQKYNFEPQVVYIPGAPPNIAALLSGDLDFTIFAGPASVAATVEGADVQVLMSFINTMDHSFFAVPAIKGAADLKKKTIGISRPGSADDYGLRILLRKWGLDPDKDVAIITAGGQPTRLTAMQVGRIDASLFQLPTTAQARKEGLKELAFLGDLGIDYLGTSVVATRSMIQKNPNFVQRFVKAFAEGIYYYKTNKEPSIRSLAKFTKLNDRLALEEAYGTYALKLLPQVPYPSTKGIEVILEDLGQKNPKARNLDPRRFSDPRFLKDLEDSGFIAQLYRN
jgi:ABC-type nitrate/sulfonate/bicarbonate transport system substrate-binding protein